jgi:putative FmdB family regulatory protein
MPIYEIFCEECGPGEEYSKVADRDNIRCPDCHREVERILSPVTTVGVVWDKCLEVPSIGRTFRSNAEVRQYEKENPGFAFMTKDSPEMKRKREVSRNRVERLAKRSGYSDWDAMRRHRTAEKKKKAAKANSAG